MAVRDEFISDERYAGTVRFVGMGWSKFHETYGFRLQLEYQSASALKNYNVSAMITQYRLGLSYLYPVGGLQLMAKKVAVYLGPTAELFLHYRKQNIANGGDILDVYSFASLFSGGIRSEAVLPISEDLQAQAAVQTSIVSLGGRIVDPLNSSTSFTKLLTLLAGFNADAEIKISYRLTDALVAAADYRFDLTRISAWDFFISADDNFVASLSYGF
ncbi:MAG: hypothetical protein KGJ59_12705 [Bacteroidota bacterium]|nr:hypothetical protein [Bacteroidota bacterium]